MLPRLNFEYCGADINVPVIAKSNQTKREAQESTEEFIQDGGTKKKMRSRKPSIQDHLPQSYLICQPDQHEALGYASGTLGSICSTVQAKQMVGRLYGMNNKIQG